MGKLKSVSTILFLMAGSILFPAFIAQAADDVVGKKFYTLVNIWYESPGPIDSTNYHKGVIVPLGTQVRITEVYDGSGPVRNALDPTVLELFIRFDVAGGQPYRILFQPRYAKPGMTLMDLFRQYFSEQDPMAPGGAFRSLSREEQKSVLAGEITPGMSKAAVIMAYGYPPSHKTPALAADTWVYWDSRFKTRTVSFQNDKVEEVAESGRRESRRAPREKKRNAGIDECIKACKENTTRTAEQCFDACNK